MVGAAGDNWTALLNSRECSANTVKMYSPGAASKAKRPEGSDIVCRAGLLVRSKVILALGIGEPVGSVTVPVIVAVWDFDCAKHEAVMSSTANSVKARWRLDRMFI